MSLPDSFFQPDPPTPPNVSPTSTPAPVVPTQPSSNVPVAPTQPNEGPIAAFENKIIAPLDEASNNFQANPTSTFNVTPQDQKINDAPGLTPEQQTAKFGGPVGSPAYSDYLVNHPYSEFLGKVVGGVFGVQFPEQETWDKMTPEQQAAYSGKAVALAAAKAAIRLPRQIPLAVARIPYSFGWLVKGGLKNEFNSLTGKGIDQPDYSKQQITIPWLGTVKSWGAGLDAIDKANPVPFGWNLATVSRFLQKVGLVGGDLAIGYNAATDIFAGATESSALAPAMKPTNAEEFQKAFSGVTEVKTGTPSPNKYYENLPPEFTKEYGGTPKNTYLKVTPVGIGTENPSLELSVVRVRGKVGSTFSLETKVATNEFTINAPASTPKYDFEGEMVKENQTPPPTQNGTSVTPEAQPGETYTPAEQPPTPEDLNASVPQNVYHGTTPEAAADIKVNGIKPSARGIFGQGAYFTNSEGTLDTYGKDGAIAVNPSKFNLKTFSTAQEQMDFVKSQGFSKLSDTTAAIQKEGKYDGFIVPNTNAEVGDTHVFTNLDKLNAEIKNPPEAPPLPPLSGIDSVPLKGYENKPVTPDQLTYLGRIAAFNKITPEMAQGVIKMVSGKDLAGDMTQGEYVKAQQAMAALRNENLTSNAKDPNAAESNVPFFRRYFAPTDHWMSDVEEMPGGPKLKSQVYDPIERASVAEKDYNTKNQNLIREIAGKYFDDPEIQNLLNAYMRGNHSVVDDNEALTPEVKADIKKMADGLAPLVKKMGHDNPDMTEKMLKNPNYLPILKDIQGTIVKYKNDTDLQTLFQPFYENAREGNLNQNITNPFALLDIYSRVTAKKLFMEPAFQSAAKVMAGENALPYRDSVKNYQQEKLGYADDLERAVNQISNKYFPNLFGAAPDVARKLLNNAQTWLYGMTEGLRPAAAVRQMLLMNNVTARLGSAFSATTLGQMAQNYEDMLKELESHGLRVKQGEMYGADTVKQPQEFPGQFTSEPLMAGLKKSLAPLNMADDFTRVFALGKAKNIWQNAMGLVNDGTIAASDFGKKINIQKFRLPDQATIKGFLAKGDYEGAFHHYVTDIVHETLYPYTKASGSQALSYGATGKVLGAFTNYFTQHSSMIGRWVKTGQWDNLIRLYGSASLAKRTIADTTGLDISNWVSTLIAPALGPVWKVGNDVMQGIAAANLNNQTQINASVADIINELKTIGFPGVTGKGIEAFWTSVNRTFGGSPTSKTMSPDRFVPPDMFGVYSNNGTLLYPLTFAQLLAKTFGFSTVSQSAKEQSLSDANTVYNSSPVKAATKQAYQYLLQGQPDKAIALQQQYGFKFSPTGFQQAGMPLLWKYVRNIPKADQAGFNPALLQLLQRNATMGGGE